jgi:hypothetical protein
MTSITSASRQLNASLTNTNRLSQAMEGVGPNDLQRAVKIKRQMQVELTVQKVEIQEARQFERKLLNEVVR